MSRHLTVLVVDSDEMLRQLLRRALERLERRVLVAADLGSGLALLDHAEERIDLVVADVLPGEDGDEIAARIRRHDPDVAVLLISTGVNEPGETPELEKPFTPAQLEQRIQGLLAARGRVH